MDVTSRTELRGVIKFCSGADMTLIDTFKFISKAPTSVKCSRSLVFKWHQRFSTGDTSLEDQKQVGSIFHCATSHVNCATSYVVVGEQLEK